MQNKISCALSEANKAPRGGRQYQKPKPTITATAMIPVDYCRYLAGLELIALDQARKRRRVLLAIQSSSFSPSSSQRNVSYHALILEALSGDLRLCSPPSLLLMQSTLQKEGNAANMLRPVSKLQIPASTGKIDVSKDRQLSDVPTPPPAKRAKHKDVQWMSNLDVLRQYKEEHGDCVVPRGSSANPRLANWVAEQRKQRKLLIDGKQSKIIPERVKLLDEIGFVWNAQEAAWERQLTDLKEFREQKGHCLVPVRHSKLPRLGFWVKGQRRQYVLMKQGKPSHMTDERAAKLDSVGFCWNTQEASWLERFHELSEYTKTNGHSVVPDRGQETQRLGTWVHHQRRGYKKYRQGKPSHMTAERIDALETLDFVWHPLDCSWADVASYSDSMISLQSLGKRKR
jgi:hypothetical protein